MGFPVGDGFCGNGCIDGCLQCLNHSVVDLVEVNFISDGEWGEQFVVYCFFIFCPVGFRSKADGAGGWLGWRRVDGCGGKTDREMVACNTVTYR